MSAFFAKPSAVIAKHWLTMAKKWIQVEIQVEILPDGKSQLDDSWGEGRGSGGAKLDVKREAF